MQITRSTAINCISPEGAIDVNATLNQRHIDEVLIYMLSRKGSQHIISAVRSTPQDVRKYNKELKKLGLKLYY